MPLFTAHDPIVERLKACCPAAGDNVFAAADLAGVKERSQVTPALHVVLHSYAPAGDDGAGELIWEETYLVVAAVRHASQRAAVESIRRAAAELLNETLTALNGWKCPGTVGLMHAIAPPNPLITDSTGYFPLAFRVGVATEGASGEY